MRRILAAVFAAVTAAAASAISAAALPVMEPDLPFNLTAPEHVAITYLNGNDSLNTCEIAYSQSSEMSAFFSAMVSDREKAQADLLEKGFFYL